MRKIKKRATEYKTKSFIQGFNYAVDGIVKAFRSEFNMRVHLLAGVFAILLSLFFDFTRMEFMALSLTIALVFIAEMINTAIEKTVDLLSPEYAEAAGAAKDIAAGAVLIASVNSLVMAYLLFFTRIDQFRTPIYQKIQANPWYLALIIVLLVVLFAVILKGLFYRGHGSHFQGGTVSGHSAIAFCMATLIAVWVNKTLITLLAYFLAFLVAESRVEGKIHYISEVIIGGIFGTLLTLLILAIFQ